MNSHYVTRGLTKPWETKGRKLFYYDFRKDKILKKSSRSLLVQENLLTQKEEILYNQNVEDKLIKLKHRLLKSLDETGKFDAKLNQKDWEALALYVFAQTERNRRKYNALNKIPDSNKSKKSILYFFNNEAAKKYLAHQFFRDCEFSCFLTPPDSYLFFPESGFTLIPIGERLAYLKENDRYPFIFYIPVSPTRCFVFVFRYIKKILQTNEFRKFILKASVGYNESKVIIPPKLYKKFKDSEVDLIKIIKKNRFFASAVKGSIFQRTDQIPLPEK